MIAVDNDPLDYRPWWIAGGLEARLDMHRIEACASGRSSAAWGSPRKVVLSIRNVRKTKTLCPIAKRSARNAQLLAFASCRRAGMPEIRIPSKV
jgi:hypothetical protein